MTTIILMFLFNNLFFWILINVVVIYDNKNRKAIVLATVWLYGGFLARGLIQVILKSVSTHESLLNGALENHGG